MNKEDEIIELLKSIDMYGKLSIAYFIFLSSAAFFFIVLNAAYPLISPNSNALAAIIIAAIPTFLFVLRRVNHKKVKK